MYDPFAFFVGRTVADIPLQMIEVLIFSVMTYWLAGLTAADGTAHFWLFCVTLIGVRMTGQQFTTSSSWIVYWSDYS